MPEHYRPNEESQEIARNLASLTVNDLDGFPHEERRETAPLEMHARQLGVDAPLHDVAFVMEEFAWQRELARQVGDRMPCVRVSDEQEEGNVPLSLQVNWPFPRSPGWIRSAPLPPEALAQYHDYLHQYDARDSITMEPTNKVLERLKKSLGDFLAYRIDGFRAWTSWMMGGGQGGPRYTGKVPPGVSGLPPSGGPPPPLSSAPGGGLGVELWCNSPGLTIEFSHAYFIHFVNFGAPSSPVKNAVLAGRYIFQGKGPTCPSGTARSQIFRIPPDYKAVTTLF